ncbi:MAG: glycosyltransferase family 39 protein [Phycisphaerales bacterium]|nr:glycosyltransferase family 39 protein [Phycisphaerales bacterium]MCB9856218.1 glycosyltransferase family 39 protein [Phycisphaerales bacterium]MCB9863343.1 glycosyltransferase family 39 protein [Phycisphaerales bacterium]
MGRALVAIGLMTAIGLAILKAHEAPITYDEAYTFLQFARKHTGDILSDYEYPNNHILHTIAVRMTTRWFGDSLFAIRLPAVLGGIALLGGVVALSRRFDEPVRSAWPVCVAFLPVVMQYNTLARGYSLGAAACLWAAVLLVRALDDARHSECRTRDHRLRLIAVGLLLGFAVGCVPTFGLFAAGLLAATMLIRFVRIRPIRLRAAIVDGLLIAAGTLPILLVVYGRVRLKPREWPWGFGDWQSCNRAFWEHTLDWPGAMNQTPAIGMSIVIALAATVSLIGSFRRNETAQSLLLATFAFGVLALVSAKTILGTVWPLPRTIHWLAPFCLLAVLDFVSKAVRSPRARNGAATLIAAIVVVWGLSRWNIKRFSGWEDNADVPSIVEAIERDAAPSQGSTITIAVPWRFDVCVKYAVRQMSQHHWRVLTIDGNAADYVVLADNEPTPVDAILLDNQPISAIRIARRIRRTAP